MIAVLIVIPDADRLPAVLDALRAAGAPGATVSESQGMEFLTWFGAHPGMARHLSMEGEDRVAGRTVLSVVPESAHEAVIEAAETVLQLDRPGTGLVCSWPIGHFRCAPRPVPGRVRTVTIGGRP